MLRFDVRAIPASGIPTEGVLAPEDPGLRDLDARLAGPVTVEGTLRGAGAGSFRWQGRIRTLVSGECRRCLADLVAPLDTEVEAIFSSAADALEDPSVYPLPDRAAAVDLTEAVREELGLAAPAYPLCREGCAGLCPRCGANLNEGPCGCAPGPDTT